MDVRYGNKRESRDYLILLSAVTWRVLLLRKTTILVACTAVTVVGLGVALGFILKIDVPLNVQESYS